MNAGSFELECITTSPDWLVIYVCSTVHQCCGDNTLPAASAISYARHQFCSNGMLSNASHIQSRHCSTPLRRLPSKRTEQRSPICNESQWNAEQEKIEREIEEEEKEQDWAWWVSEREDWRIASTIRDGRNQFSTKWERLIWEWNKKNSDRGQVWGRKGGLRRRGRWKDDRKRDITQRRLKVTDRQDCKRVRDLFLMCRHLMCQSRIKRFSKFFFFFFLSLLRSSWSWGHPLWSNSYFDIWSTAFTY